MKINSIKTILAILLGFGSALAQTSASLDTNNISAKFFANGKLFDGFFEVPKGSGKNSIYAGNIWIGGKDTAGQLHIAAQTYGQSGSDFFFGPVGSSYFNPTFVSNYNKVWKVSKSAVDNHIMNHNNTGYVVPTSIANWPGNGNTANGESAVLAPYFDANGNGTYDPASGDYPRIRGDQAVFFIINDDKQAHGESGGAKLGIEIHGMAYSFNNPADSALNQTVFLNYNIYNRSSFSYDSVYFGAWSDMDLGTYSDDFVGSDSINNMYYTYNGDTLDENAGYGYNPPAQGNIFLNNPLSRFVYYNNDNSPTGNPTTAQEFYNYLKGIWKDGTAMTYGGTGYGGTTPASYMFSGDPASGSGWTEAGSGNTPADRRGMMSAGPFNLPSGSNICVDLAYTFARDYTNPYPGSVSLLKNRAQAIQTFYNNQNFTCSFPSGLTASTNNPSDLKVWPNPSQGLFNFESSEAIKHIRLTNLLGQEAYYTTPNTNRASINLCHLPKGIYLYQIQQKEPTSGKIIIE